MRSANAPTAMLVDDEPLLRGMVARILSRAGYRVLEAEDGESALHASTHAARPIDILVSDVCMPGITGWELAVRLRNEWPALKTVIMSGAETEPSRTPEPGTSFLRKPFDPDTLLEHVGRLLEEG